MLILNFCISGRCDVSLAGNRYAIVKEAEALIMNDLERSAWKKLLNC